MKVSTTRDPANDSNVRDRLSWSRKGTLGTASPGLSSSKMYLSLAKSFDISEYAGEIGATGTPTCMAPSASRA